MKSEDRPGLDAHTEGSSAGDIKIRPGTPGANVLPDGTIALTAAAVRDTAALSEAAKTSSQGVKE